MVNEVGEVEDEEGEKAETGRDCQVPSPWRKAGADETGDKRTGTSAIFLRMRARSKSRAAHFVMNSIMVNGASARAASK